MPIARLKCRECGLSVTRIGTGQNGVVSVDAAQFVEHCPRAAAVAASGELHCPLENNCPQLGAAMVENDSASEPVETIANGKSF